MAAKTITAIIPAKNEADTIQTVIGQVPRDLVDEIIVVDGHSTDRTVALAKETGVRVIEQEGKGYGAGVATGLKHAKGDLVTMLDADGSYDVAALKELRNRIESGFDVAFCSRYLPESGSDDDTPVRLLGNKLFTFLLNKIHGVRITDALFLYVLAKREVFQKIKMESTHFEYCIEFPIRVHKAGFKYTEIPSRELKRIAGDSKVNAFSDGLRILWTVLKG